ncbi:MAG TPA: thioredoxin domain-containing protein [Candidatus Nitrosotalea sp.]|nr:thioredoxin domain-containing protein [Candidatus Nitrosotalea sp.]
MKRYYYLAIPAVITIIAVAYMATPHENKIDEITPQMVMQNGSPLLGDANAKITIVEFGDYQCTYCHLFHENTKDALLQQYVNTGKVNFVFRDFPLNGPDSVLAADAAYCAGDQNKYWQYHDELYKNWGGEKTGWVNQKSLDKFATTVGLDLGKFDKCVSDKKYEQKVIDNYNFGQKIGIDGTPSFIVFSGKQATKIVGAQPISVFDQVLAKFQNS